MATAVPTEPAKTDWSRALAPYARPRVSASVSNLVTSVGAYFALVAAMYLVVDSMWWLALLLAVPAAGFLVRTFIVFHDCTHGNFLPEKKANVFVGTVLGLLVFTTFAPWKHDHQVHHATAGDLDRRGVGDVETITVAEYLERSPGGQRLYRVSRNPWVMFLLGPVIAMMILPRFVPGGARPRIKKSIILTDVALVVLVGAQIVLFGWDSYLIVQGPVVLMAGAAGIWLFYVQHQFEGAYWKPADEWDYTEAALQGASFLKLPRVLQFFSGNIGFHHVHHLSARIPNYNLEAAHHAFEEFRSVPQISFWDGMRATRLKLWCEERGRLVTFREVRAAA